MNGLAGRETLTPETECKLQGTDNESPLLGRRPITFQSELPQRESRRSEKIAACGARRSNGQRERRTPGNTANAPGGIRGKGKVVVKTAKLSPEHHISLNKNQPLTKCIHLTKIKKLPTPSWQTENTPKNPKTNNYTPGGSRGEGEVVGKPPQSNPRVHFIY